MPNGFLDMTQPVWDFSFSDETVLMLSNLFF